MTVLGSSRGDRERSAIFHVARKAIMSTGGVRTWRLRRGIARGQHFHGWERKEKADY
jgi:hypothetical protein